MKIGGRGCGDVANWISSQLARLDIPTPFEVGNVNVYVVEHMNRFFMVDCGPDTEEAWTSLTTQLAELELTLADIDFLFLTHHHADHAGQAWRLRDASIPVYGHEKLVRYLEQTPNFIKRGNQFLHDLAHWFGTPETIVNKLPDYREALRWIGPTTVTMTFEDGQDVTSDGAWKTIHLPGHASDQLGLLGPGGVLIAGDHLIDAVEPNPLIEQPYEEEGFASPVVLYLDSLRKLQSVDLKLVVSGHGEPIHKPRPLIEARISQRYERSELLLNDWVDGLSVFDWSMRLYGRKMRRAMPLVFSEVFARLTLLEERGRVVKQLTDGKWIYVRVEDILE